MKILIVATTMGLGGAEKQITDLVKSFVIRGNDVTVIALKGEVYFELP